MLPSNPVSEAGLSFNWSNFKYPPHSLHFNPISSALFFNRQLTSHTKKPEVFLALISLPDCIPGFVSFCHQCHQKLYSPFPVSPESYPHLFCILLLLHLSLHLYSTFHLWKFGYVLQFSPPLSFT